MQQNTFKVTLSTLSGQREETVKCYNIEYHRTHTEFKDYYGKTVVAYRSESVLSVHKVTSA